MGAAQVRPRKVFRLFLLFKLGPRGQIFLHCVHPIVRAVRCHILAVLLCLRCHFGFLRGQCCRYFGQLILDELLLLVGPGLRFGEPFLQQPSSLRFGPLRVLQKCDFLLFSALPLL